MQVILDVTSFSREHDPPGVHDMSLEEGGGLFGAYQQNDQRPRLFAKLAELVVEAKAVGFVRFLIINGGFVTSQRDPGDMDLIIVVERRILAQREWTLREYNLLSRNRLRRRYPFDGFVVPLASMVYDQYLGLLRKSKGHSRRRAERRYEGFSRMIGNDQELATAVEDLGDLYRAFSGLKAELAPRNPHALILLSEGPLAEIRLINAESEEYSGTTFAESEVASLWLKLVGEHAPECVNEHETPERRNDGSAAMLAVLEGVERCVGRRVVMTHLRPPMGLRVQHRRQPVVAEVQPMNLLASRTAQDVLALVSRFHMVQPMIRLGEDMGQPHRAYPTEAEAHPVAMGGKVFVQARLHPHALELGSQQRHVIDPFTTNRQGPGHGVPPLWPRPYHNL